MISAIAEIALIPDQSPIISLGKEAAAISGSRLAMIPRGPRLCLGTQICAKIPLAGEVFSLANGCRILPGPLMFWQNSIEMDTIFQFLSHNRPDGLPARPAMLPCRFHPRHSSYVEEWREALHPPVHRIYNVSAVSAVSEASFSGGKLSEAIGRSGSAAGKPGKIIVAVPSSTALFSSPRPKKKMQTPDPDARILNSKCSADKPHSACLISWRKRSAAGENAWFFFHTRTVPVSKGGARGMNCSSSERFPI